MGFLKKIGKKLKKGAGKAAEATGKAAVAAGKATGKTATRFTKAAAATATKKAKDLIAKKKKKIADKKKTQTKVLQQQTNWSKSQAGQARNWDDLPAKTKEVMEKHKLAGGGFLKKAKGAWETSKDKAAGKKAAKARHDKLEEKGKMSKRERNKVLKRIEEKGYASGGPVRKSIDGIAQRGLTRAKHK